MFDLIASRAGALQRLEAFAPLPMYSSQVRETSVQVRIFFLELL